MRDLIILGAGEFALEAKEIALAAGKFRIACFIEGLERSRTRSPLDGIAVRWVDELAAMDRAHLVLCAIGSPKRRPLIERARSQGFEFATVVHPSAQVSPSARLGAGCLVGAGAVIGAAARVHDHVILNRGVLVGHHVEIGEAATLGPGANVAGGAAVGEGAVIGMGALVLDHRRVGRGAQIGAGAVVTRDVPERVQALGVPARVTRELDGT